MSKKAKAEEVAVIPASKITQTLALNVEARTDDILAIAVSNHEDILEQQRVHLETNIRRLTKEKEDLAKALDAAAKKQVEDQYKPELEALCKTLNDWGFVKVLPTLDTISLDLDDREITVICKIGAEDKVTPRYSYSSNSRDELQTKKTVPASDEICDMIGKLRTAEDELDKLSNLHTEVRRALANIDRVERRARAALAKKTLEATPEGRAMLETMQQVGSPFHSLLALQAPKAD